METDVDSVVSACGLAAPVDMALWRLLQLSDQLFPTGSYTFSHALETYIEHGIVQDRLACQQLFEALCRQSLGPCDMVFCTHAFRLAETNKLADLIGLDRLLTATKVARELRLESEHTGQAFLRASLALEPPVLIDQFWQRLKQGQTPGNHAIIFGLVAQGLGVTETSTLQGYLYTVVAGWVAAAVRHVPLGQTEGQRLLYQLTSILSEVIQQYRHLTPETAWSFTPSLDIRSMQHERLYSRLFRS